MKKSIIIVSGTLLATILFTATADAQPPGTRPEFQRPHRQRMTVEQEAQVKTDRMNEELSLSEKQYKKVLKLYKSQIQKERDIMEAGRPDGMPGNFPGGFPGGGPGGFGGDFPGGGPGMGGGRPPMGGGFGGDFPGGGPGMGGGRPPMGGGFGGDFPGGGPGMGGGRPPMGGGPSMRQNDDELEKLLSDKEKKFKKILTEEQFNQWSQKHPEEFSLPIPDVKLNSFQN